MLIAYDNNELVNKLAIASGEVSLHELPRKHGMLVLVALEKNKFMQRNWDSFCAILHDAQQVKMIFKRYLTSEKTTYYSC